MGRVVLGWAVGGGGGGGGAGGRRPPPPRVACFWYFPLCFFLSKKNQEDEDEPGAAPSTIERRQRQEAEDLALALKIAAGESPASARGAAGYPRRYPYYDGAAPHRPPQTYASFAEAPAAKRSKTADEPWMLPDQDTPDSMHRRVAAADPLTADDAALAAALYQEQLADIAMDLPPAPAPREQVLHPHGHHRHQHHPHRGSMLGGRYPVADAASAEPVGHRTRHGGHSAARPGRWAPRAAEADLGFYEELEEHPAGLAGPFQSPLHHGHRQAPRFVRLAFFSSSSCLLN